MFVSHLAFGAPVIVYHPHDPAPAEKAAAEELADYWSRLTGQEVTVLPEPRLELNRPGNHPFRRSRMDGPRGGAELTVFIGETRENRLFAGLSCKLDPHGFRVRKTGNRLFLRGKSPLATRFAASDFLQRHGDIRWYLPTELGEHLPETAPELPDVIDRVDAPDFVSRRWSGISREPNDPWPLRNKIAGSDRFHHRIHTIFTEAVYDLRPDFFLMMRGERMRPDDSLRGHNLQICFGNPDAAKFAARKAAEFFDENPEAMSFSLGMTDTEAICECPHCAEWIDPEKTFRQRPDYSDLVFTFMNRAAEELAKTHPNKYLGCLAYHWAENVPSFPVHPKVMPYLTADRPQWRDAGFQAEDSGLMKRWAEAGPERIGIYDYYYGSSFVIPRIFTELTDASLKHAAEVGIDGFYAEIASTWSLDGPKAWLTSQLVWDVSQDREELLAEYYENFYGPAAEPMRKFFDRAEEIWMEQAGPVFWLKFYHDFAQLELFGPEEVAEMREYLDEAARLATNRRVRERVALVSDGFRLTELYSAYYFGIKEATAAGMPIAELGWGGVVERVELALAARGALEEHYENVTLKNDLHRPSRRFETRADFFPAQKLNRLLERAAALAADDSLLEEPLVQLVERVEQTLPEARAEAVTSFGGHRGEELPIRNGGFELDAALTGLGESLVGDPDYTPFSWRRDTAAGTAPAISLSASEAREGGFSIAAEGAVEERLYQRIRVQAGEVLRLSAWAKGRISPGSQVDLEISWRRSDGQIIREAYPARDRLWSGEGEIWEKLLVVAEAPPETVFAYISVAVRNQGPEDKIYLDSIRAAKQYVPKL